MRLATFACAALACAGLAVPVAASPLSSAARVAAATAPQDPAAASAVPAEALEAELANQAVQKLVGFARVAEANKVRSRAKTAWELAVEYDPECRPARTALGFRKEKGAWQPPAKGKEPSWLDAPSAAQRSRVTTAWTVLQQELGALHRGLGLQLKQLGDDAAARRHLERAVAWDASDVESHRALGHREHDGFWGTAAQLAFLERMAAIEQKARELGETDCKADPLPASAMPVELQRTGLPFTGARTEHVTLWTTVPQDTALQTVQWGERTFLMLQFLLGDGAATHDVAGDLSRMKYFALMHSEQEKDSFLQNNRQVFDIDIGVIKDYIGWTIRAEGGRAHVSWGAAALDDDVIVAHVTEYGFAHRCNEGLAEGLVHAMTNLLVGSMHTFYGTAPDTIAGSSKPIDPNEEEWLPRLREQMDARQDWPIEQLPRERLERYRPQVRLKAWSFVKWLLARHPGEWAQLLRAFPNPEEKALMPEESTRILEQVLGRPLPAIDAEWRDWADGRSPFAKAAGNAR